MWEGDLILSTQQANEAAPQRLASAGPARRAPRPTVASASPPAPPLRPHLVSRGERRMSFDGSEVQVESAVVLEPAAAVLRPHLWEEAPRPALEQTPLRLPAYAGPKRILDIVGAVVLAVVFSPLVLAIIVFMGRWDGSIIYRHRRVGRNGQTFECLKFRTMVPNADQVLRELLERDPAIKAEWVRDHKLRCDPRVTRLGRFLR